MLLITTNSDSSWFHTFLPNCCVFEGTGGVWYASMKSRGCCFHSPMRHFENFSSYVSENLSALLVRCLKLFCYKHLQRSSTCLSLQFSFSDSSVSSWHLSLDAHNQTLVLNVTYHIRRFRLCAHEEPNSGCYFVKNGLSFLSCLKCKFAHQDSLFCSSCNIHIFTFSE
jgi:hypothetical protein